jgi:hypothetical protein
MKVYNLCCDAGHPFEGWFGSESDFLTQMDHAKIACPLCGSSRIEKRPSAPRLNLSGAKAPEQDLPLPASAARPAPTPNSAASMLALARQVLANTEDVGEQFAEEARRIHYQDAPERAIRGVASEEERAELQDEGIDVFPLLIPAALKETLQ